MNQGNMADRFGETVLDQVEKTSAYFSSIAELIPTKFYFPDVGTRKGSDTFDETRHGVLPKERKKMLSKEGKLQKLDPHKHKTVGEMQKEIEKNNHIEKSKAAKSGEHIKSVDATKVVSLPLDELRKKLHDKIELLRRKRKLDDEAEPGDTMKKSRHDKSSSKKKKQSNDTKNSIISKSHVKNEKKITQVVNDKGNVVFSKFDFAEEPLRRKRKTKSNDLQALLSKAEKTKANLEKLEEESKEKADILKSKLKWDTALKHAEGVKVKDDPKLLLKTMKKKKKMKETSKRKWEERVAAQKKQQDEKQRLRKQHLAERKEKKGSKGGKNRKHIKKAKKHKPGF